MARPIRIEYPDAYYHITSRGNAREKIFQTHQDYDGFLKVLALGVEKYNINLIGFVLMPNHYHLIIQTPRGNLSAFMRYLNGNYTQQYNRNHKRVGHVLQGRYKGILVEDDSYLLELIRYVHLNPCRAKIVDKVDQYKYSSHQAIIDQKKRKEWGKWYDAVAILEQFGSSEKQATEKYREYLADGLRGTQDSPLKQAHFGFILGSESLVIWVQKNFLEKKEDRELLGLRKIQEVIKPEMIIRTVANKMKVSEECIVTQKRGRSAQNPARGLAMFLIHKNCEMTQRDMGRLFGGISNIGVSVALRRFEGLLKTGNLDEELKRIENSLIVKT